jgi:DNA-binding phage protein
MLLAMTLIDFGKIMTRRLKTRRWDVAETLRNQADIDAYLAAVREERDLQLLQAALEDIAKVKATSARN